MDRVKEYVTIFIKSDGTIEKKIFTTNDEMLLLEVSKVIDGFCEVVRNIAIGKGYVLICDDEGLLKEKDQNLLGTILYTGIEKRIRNNHPIVGDIVIMKEQRYEEDVYLVGLSDAEIEGIVGALREVQRKYDYFMAENDPDLQDEQF